MLAVVVEAGYLPNCDPADADRAENNAERHACRELPQGHTPPLRQPQLLQGQRADDERGRLRARVPPELMIRGMKRVRTNALAISASKCCIALAVSISPMNSAASHPPRFLIISREPISM